MSDCQSLHAITKKLLINGCNLVEICVICTCTTFIVLHYDISILVYILALLGVGFRKSNHAVIKIRSKPFTEQVTTWVNAKNKR